MSSQEVAPSLNKDRRPHTHKVRDAAAWAFQRRVKRIDKFARTLIKVSGIGIICAVLGIGFFLVLVVLPLFSGAKIEAASNFSIPEVSIPAVSLFVDEYQEKAAVLGTDLRFYVYSISDVPAYDSNIVLEGLASGEKATSSHRAVASPWLSIGTSKGNVWVGQSQFITEFEEGRRLIKLSVEKLDVFSVAAGRSIKKVCFRGSDEGGVIASILDDSKLIITRVDIQEPLIGPKQKSVRNLEVDMGDLGTPMSVLVNESGTQMIVGTSIGILARWRLPYDSDPELIETVQAITKGSISALEYILGDRSIAIGGSDGSISTWSLVRSEGTEDGLRLTPIHKFPNHRASVALISASPRDKGFISVSQDGEARLKYMTSERILAQLSSKPGINSLIFSPKANGFILADASGLVEHRRFENPHPDISLKSLFGKIWYEGYEKPEYIWQSHGATDDFESKFSLVPLVFGTLKGTFYALIFAIPISVFGALYCSQFLNRRLRSPIKSAIELMAALPSVVIGFVAGVLLSPMVEQNIVTLLGLPVMVPLVGVSGMLLSTRLPFVALKNLAARMEFWVIAFWLVVGIFFSIWLGPFIERAVFSGSFQGWLMDSTGASYDQRNSLVVGWAMGFAVIPIIFTICEDAFSAVPRNLVAASLACGASPWQTAFKVVMPAAGSGVFSAIMVGFGRAIGETMIVLMATGNTPIMDLSVFNGFRALSANIAVEMPEAPYGSTHYRVLFVAALLLFFMAFVVNTLAELVRIRLRKRLHGL